MKYLSVRNFEHFQHYKDRSPVWIKLYNSVMDDEAFLALNDAQRGQLVLIWLLASRRDNKIPRDGKAIARAIQSSGRVDVERFVTAGFLVPYQSASDVLAEPEQSAIPHVRPRARGEGEREKETEKSHLPPPPAVAFDAVTTLLERIPESSRPAWRAELASAEMGMHGPAMSSEQIQMACRDYLGNENEGKRSLRHFRGYLRSIAEPRPETRSSAAPAADGGDAAWLAVIELLPAWQRREITAEIHAQLPAGTRRGLSAIGGFQRIQNTAADQRTWLKKEFLAAFRSPSPERAHA